MPSSGDVAVLSTEDYAVFCVLLGISTAVGIFFAYRDRKQKAVNNYVFANRNIPPLASGFSASLSFLSGVTVIGLPAEMVYFGAVYTWFLLGYLFAITLGCELFLPIYHKLGLSSANEYFGLRFGKTTRYVATVIYLVQSLTYSGVMMYTPALALHAVTTFSLWGAILSVGIVCTVYTTLGGLKAVIWTDVLQGVFLFIVVLIVLIKTTSELGGIGNVFRTAAEGGRLDYFVFDFDPRHRMTFWGAVLGLGFMRTSITATNQAVVQRFLCCGSVADGKKAFYSSIFVASGIIISLTFIGFTAYAYFADCDPLISGQISARDQIVPYMTLKVFKDMPGLPGLFISGIFAAALSTVSSSLNAMSSVTVGDLVRPNVNWRENTLLWASRGLTFIYGVLCIVFAYLASILGGLLEATLTVLGIFAGSLLGPVVLGTLFPVANEIGTISGMVIAIGVNVWIYVGASFYPPPTKFLGRKVLRVDGCPAQNFTMNETSTTNTIFSPTFSSQLLENTNERPTIAELYAVSFTYYGLIGLLVCVAVGMLVSCATGGLKSRQGVDPKLINLPFEHPVLKWLPEKFRRFMRPKMGNPEDFAPCSSKESMKSHFCEEKCCEAKVNSETDHTFDDDEEVMSTAM